VFPGASVSLAVLVPPGTPILIVDGIGDIGNTTVVPTVMAFPVANGFEFGQASGGIFSPIMSGVTALAGGSLVDFAIHEIGKPFTSFASLTAPGPFTVSATLGTPLPSSFAQAPSPVIGDYFNSLSLVWNIGAVPIEFDFLNGGAGLAGTDGFQAVPIPTVALLFGTGLIGLIGIARRSLFVK